MSAPEAVVTAGTMTQRIVSQILEATERRTPTRVTGRGNWLSAGRPVKSEGTISLRDDSGVVAYVPGDLTLTVRAGTSLSEIEHVTREHDQWLPLDPYGSPDGSIGATIATASSGPLAHNFGLARDLVLGLEFVTGRGDVIRSGGRVVKNVAGFDLSRLLTGSWGTLGVITEVTLRLYARPKVDRTFIVRLGGGEQESTRLLAAFHAAPLNPYAMELLNAPAAQALGLGSGSVCVFRLGGNEAVVDSQLLTLSRLAKTDEVSGDTWSSLRALEHAAECVIRISGLPTHFRAAAATILADVYPGIYTYVNPTRGAMRVVATAGARANGGRTVDAVRAVDLSESTRRGEVMIYETLPAEVWNDVAPAAISSALAHGIKKAYDPHNVLNPGILGD